MFKLVLIRHGQSEWNLKNLFTGWTDVDLTPLGVLEAKEAGQKLLKAGFDFDLSYTSMQKRAIRTLWLILEEMDRMWLPVIKDWRLNERHYGQLQGQSKIELAEKLGQEKVHEIRRGYSTRPPLLSREDTRNPKFDTRYKNLDSQILPLGESLEDTNKRLLPYFESEIKPKILEGQKILISAHGNSLRVLIKCLEDISDQEITQVEIPTGQPLIYEIDSNFRFIQKYYL